MRKLDRATGDWIGWDRIARTGVAPGAARGTARAMTRAMTGGGRTVTAGAGRRGPDVGFIGLGVMGSAMAANLLATRPLLVWNRTAAASDRLARAGADVAGSAAEVFERCEVVFLMLSDEHATDDVVRSDGTVELAGRLVVQMSTVAPEHSRAVAARVRDGGGRYVEAPVSGSRQPAIDGELIAMVAGHDADVDRVTPLLDPMCSAVFPCGEVPGALTMKLAVNTFLVTLVTGLAESFHFAEEHGLDVRLLEQILGAGPMASAVSRAKAAKLVHQDWTVHAAVPDVLKNSRLVVQEARRSGNASPLMDVCAQLFAETEALGHDRADMAAVVAALRSRTDRLRTSPRDGD
jgi:3-hydroxyisobutyrate dehydrogenase